MNGRENVRRAIEFGVPDHMPVTSSLFGEVEFWHVGLETPSYTPRVPGATEWGHTMRKTSVPNHGVPDNLPIETWDMLDDYVWPDPRNDERYRSIGPRLEDPASRDRYVHMGWFVGLYDTILRLRGWEESMMDFVAEPDRMKGLTAKVAEFIVTAIDTLAEKFPGQIHGLCIPDDWGGQTGLFMSVDMWEEFFGEHYREFGRQIHDAGMHFWLHSDGRINDLMETLIDCGVDVINMPSPRAVGIDEISERFAGRICFANGIDIQSTMVWGSDEEIEEEARLLAEKWNTPEGGFIPGVCGYIDTIGSDAHRWLVQVNALRRHCYGLPPLEMDDVREHLARLQ
ncbi:MAG: uroporphyrinogen decarboxylase family protein [Planctomycetota bacterium]|jgi:hypothetical protein